MKDSPAQFQATIKAVEKGIWHIQCQAIFDDAAAVGRKGSAIADLYINITDEKVEVSDISLWPKPTEPLNKDVPPPLVIPPLIPKPH